MPIVLQNREYTDIFGNVRSFYKANAGDLQNVRFTLRTSISVQSSVMTTLTLDPINNIVTWIGGNFEDEGFRPTDTILFQIYHSNGNIHHTWTTACTSVNGNLLDVNAIPHWYDASNGEIIVISVQGRQREGLRLSLNHVNNLSQGAPLSLIDGEATQSIFDLTQGFPVAVQKVSRQSGQFYYTAAIEYAGQTGIYTDYFLVIDVIQSGLYDSQWFDSTSCLKLYAELSWQSLLGEPYANTINVISENADTGWYDEPFNQDVLDAALIQGASGIAYDIPTSVTIQFDSTSSDIAWGFAYVPSDATYYKNKFPDQSTFTGICPTQLAIGTLVGTPLPNGGTMSMNLLTLGQVGTLWTATLQFLPDAQFTAFMQALPDQERLFYAWVKVGNLNLLFHSGNLQTFPPQGGELNVLAGSMDDHSENTIDFNGVDKFFYCNTEDDIALSMDFLLPEGVPSSNLYARVEAHNSTTNEAFTLTQVNFDLTQIPMQSGVLPINMVAPVITTLPTTSVKREANLYRKPSLDITGYYGVHLHFPFLVRWEYWLQQPNADGDFYPNQDRYWYKYDTTGDWSVRVKVESIQDGLSYTAEEDFIILDYDHNDAINSSIDLIRESTGQIVNSVIQGEIMRVVGTHVSTAGDWDPLSTWGMITIEPKESAPRWICSTIVDNDGNTSNPLTPLSGTLASITYPAPNVAVIECLFDSNKINTQNGVKFTSKIKQNCDNLPIQKSTTTGEDKITTENIKKVTA
jgi:hypothetical protein